METKEDASDDSLLYCAQSKSDSELLWCMHCSPFEAYNTGVAVYYKVVSRPCDQRAQHNAPSTVCDHLMTLVKISVVHHIFRPVW